MEKARRHKFQYMWVVAVCWVHLQATIDPPWIEADEELQPIRLMLRLHQKSFASASSVGLGRKLSTIANQGKSRATKRL